MIIGFWLAHNRFVGIKKQSTLTKPQFDNRLPIKRDFDNHSSITGHLILLP